MELLPFQHLIEKLTDINGGLWNLDHAIHSEIYEFNIEMPVELEIMVNEEGKVEIGSVPPLYYVDTTFRPSYHAIRFTAVKFDNLYGSSE